MWNSPKTIYKLSSSQILLGKFCLKFVIHAMSFCDLEWWPLDHSDPTCVWPWRHVPSHYSSLPRLPTLIRVITPPIHPHSNPIPTQDKKGGRRATTQVDMRCQRVWRTTGHWRSSRRGFPESNSKWGLNWISKLHTTSLSEHETIIWYQIKWWLWAIILC